MLSFKNSYTCSLILNSLLNAVSRGERSSVVLREDSRDSDNNPGRRVLLVNPERDPRAADDETTRDVHL